MSDYPMLISNKLHSFRNFAIQIYKRMNETDNSYRTNVNNIGYWFWFSAEQTDCR